MIVGTPAQRPVITPVGVANGRVVDRGKPAAHQTIFVELPILVPVEPVPLSQAIAGPDRY
jgi:hypothetical protein